MCMWSVARWAQTPKLGCMSPAWAPHVKLCPCCTPPRKSEKIPRKFPQMQDLRRRECTHLKMLKWAESRVIRKRRKSQNFLPGFDRYSGDMVSIWWKIRTRRKILPHIVLGPVPRSDTCWEKSLMINFCFFFWISKVVNFSFLFELVRWSLCLSSGLDSRRERHFNYALSFWWRVFHICRDSCVSRSMC